ncbi:MAG: ABC transporter ATP-binding protein [Acidimicrobiales bacterium]
MTKTEIEDSPGFEVICRDLFHLYSTAEGDVVALRSVDLKVQAGEIVALVGPSGMGKSTLLGLMGGLFAPTTGAISVGPYDLARLSEREKIRMRSIDVAMVLQNSRRNLLPYATVLENLAFSERALPRPRRKGSQYWMEVLTNFAIEHLTTTSVASLSGGERQRVAFAAAVVGRPRLLLVDEPTSELDTEAKAAVIDALRSLNERDGTTIVVVTHDPAVARAASRSLTIRDGRVGSQASDGVEHLVVGRDGALQLPRHILEHLPPHSLVALQLEGERVILERVHREP